MTKSRKKEGRKKSRRRVFRVLLLLAVMAGCYAAFNLPEERRNRINKLVFEAREMPFRLFV